MKLSIIAAALFSATAFAGATYKPNTPCPRRSVGTKACDLKNCAAIICKKSPSGKTYWRYKAHCDGNSCRNGHCTGNPVDFCPGSNKARDLVEDEMEE